MSADYTRKVLVYPARNITAKIYGNSGVTFGDTESTVPLLGPPSGYFIVIWRVELTTDSNTDHAILVADGNLVSFPVGAGFNGPVIDNTTYPEGVPVKTLLALRAQAVAGTTTTIAVRVWYWLIPNKP